MRYCIQALTAADEDFMGELLRLFAEVFEDADAYLGHLPLLVVADVGCAFTNQSN